MSRIPRLPTRLLVGAVVMLAILLAAETVVLAAGTWKLGAGPVKAVNAAHSNDYLNLTSTTLTDMPSMSVTVTVPRDQTALLVITFSAETQCTGSNAWCHVQAFVDSSAADPTTYSFDTAVSDTEEAHTMQWVEGPVGPGIHRVRIRYLVGPSDGGGTFIVGARTLTVMRAKM